MERKMAIQLSTDYLAGMTDRSFAEVAIQTGLLSPDVLKNGVRGVIESEQVNKLLKKLDETYIDLIITDKDVQSDIVSKLAKKHIEVICTGANRQDI